MLIGFRFFFGTDKERYFYHNASLDSRALAHARPQGVFQDIPIFVYYFSVQKPPTGSADESIRTHAHRCTLCLYSVFQLYLLKSGRKTSRTLSTVASCGRSIAHNACPSLRISRNIEFGAVVVAFRPNLIWCCVYIHCF